MAFTWDWLLLRMIDTGILDYYQMNVCNSYSDFVLFKLGRSRGVLLTECHIIKRTSPRCYRVTSFDFDTAYYKSCRSADEVCQYIIETFIPDYIKPVSTAEKLAELRARRAERVEKGEAIKEGFCNGEYYVNFERDCAKILSGASKKF